MTGWADFKYPHAEGVDAKVGDSSKTGYSTKMLTSFFSHRGQCLHNN